MTFVDVNDGLPAWANERALEIVEQAGKLPKEILVIVLATQLTLAFEEGVGEGIDRLANNLKAKP